MYYLCIAKREDMHTVRTLSFAVLTISELRSLYMYM